MSDCASSRLADAGRMAMPGDVSMGVVFEGRKAENAELVRSLWVLPVEKVNVEVTSDRAYDSSQACDVCV